MATDIDPNADLSTMSNYVYKSTILCHLLFQFGTNWSRWANKRFIFWFILHFKMGDLFWLIVHICLSEKVEYLTVMVSLSLKGIRVCVLFRKIVYLGIFKEYQMPHIMELSWLLSYVNVEMCWNAQIEIWTFCPCVIASVASMQRGEEKVSEWACDYFFFF